jgi:hypothetical protein
MRPAPRLAVLLVLIVASAILRIPPGSPAAATPARAIRVGPELPVSTPTTQPAWGSYTPSVVWNGRFYLVVWCTRGDPNTTMVARVAPDGTLLDRRSRYLTTDCGIPAWNGRIFVVVKYNYSSGSILAIRLGPDGLPLDRRAHRIGSGYLQAVGSDGRGFAVFVTTETSIAMLRLDANGRPVDGEPLPVLPDPGGYPHVEVAWNGSDYLVVWTGGDPPRIAAALVSPDGEASHPISLLRNTSVNVRPSVASAGGDFLVAWEREPENEYSGPVEAVRISGNGDVLDSSPLTLDRRDSYPPEVTSNGSVYLVTWSAEEFHVTGARVDPDGTVLDEPPFEIKPVRTGTNGTGSASDGNGFLVSWSSFEGAPSVVAKRVGADGTMDRTTIGVAFQNNEQHRPAIAFGGGVYLAAWIDSRGTRNGPALYVGRLDSTGKALDGDGIQVTGHTGFNRNSPTVTWGGSSFLVTWTEEGKKLWAVRVGVDGSILDPEPMSFGGDVILGYTASVASDGDGWFIVWENRILPGHAIEGVFVDSDGRRSDTLHLVPHCGVRVLPSLAWNGTEYLLAWAPTGGYSERGDVYAVRLSPLGLVLDDAPFDVADTRDFEFAPIVASDGDGFLVTWTKIVKKELLGLEGARVSSNGEVLDPTPMTLVETSPVRVFASMAWDGTNYLVAYVRCGARYEYYCPYPQGDVLGVRVSPDDGVLDPSPIELAATPGHEVSPAPATGPPGTAILAYERFAPERPYGGVYRVFVRLLRE